MARILMAVWSFPTHVGPNLALAEALRADGHEVRFYSGERARDDIEAAGFTLIPFDRVDERHVIATVDALIAARRRPLQAGRLWRAFLVDTVPGQIADLDVTLKTWPADAIVCDLALWGPMLILHERDGIPVAMFSHVANCLLPTTGRAPAHRHPPGLVGRAAAGIRSMAAHLVTAGVRSRANALRVAHGLPRLDVSVTQFSGRMPLYLVPSAPEFDYMRTDLPATVHYVGPCLWSDPRARSLPDLPGVSGERPRILVDEGGLYTAEPTILERAAEALEGAPLAAVLMAGLGRDPAEPRLQGLSPRAAVTSSRYYPGMLPRAAAVITNGNTESVLRAMCAGVPVVVIPSLWDQEEVAWRVADAAAGVRLTPRRCTPDRLRRAMEDVLTDPAYRRNAERIGAALRRRGGPAEAARLVAALAGPRRGGPGAN